VTEHIPEDVTRAKSNALLTILAPFIQLGGWWGESIAHRRKQQEQLRIYRQETLSAITELAAPQLARLKPPKERVPIKFLVPFIEQASLEEPDSDLVKMWANLLVSSVANYNTDNVYYVRLLSQMSSVQARLFEAIIGPGGPRSALLAMEENFFLGRDFLLDRIRGAIKGTKKAPTTLPQVEHLD
jgi:hypothetical protein